jgi:glyoxylase-like metal-dependent hydrolase (beta-lactamase superfamily II)
MLHVRSFTFSPIQENTYLVYNEAGDACIIDPGCYHEYEKQQLSGFIEQQKLVPALLLNTHCHLDHVFGLAWAAEKYGLTPHIHFSENQMLELAPMNGDMWGMPFKGYKGPLNWLKEGEKIRLGNEEMQILFAPGHSPGHVCFYYTPSLAGPGKLQTPFVIAGDVLFKQSIGRTDLPGGNFKTLIESIREQLFILPDETIVYPGHGEPTTIGFEKKYNPFLQ